jgi:hypothetical protein
MLLVEKYSSSRGFSTTYFVIQAEWIAERIDYAHGGEAPRDLHGSTLAAWLRSVPSARAKKDERLKVLIGESFARSRQIYGSPRVHADLADERVGRNRVIRLMQGEKLVARIRRADRSPLRSGNARLFHLCASMPVAVLVTSSKSRAPHRSDRTETA